MVDFLGCSGLADYYTVVSLMVLQVVMILAVVHRDVTGFGLPQLGRSIFIDRTSAIIRLGGRTIDVMNRS